MSWPGAWARAQITGVIFSTMVWIVVAGLSLTVAVTVLGVGILGLLVRDIRAGLWWRFGARPASSFERDRVQAAIVPVASLRGRHQPRIWIGSRTGPGEAVVPTCTDLVVSPSLFRRIVTGELSDESASALVSHALGQQPVSGSRLVAVVDAYCLPWRLVEVMTAVFTASVGRSGLMSASWKIRWIVFGVAIIDNAHAARWGALVVVVIVAVLSGTTPVFRRRWHDTLRTLGDRQVIAEGLGPALASMIRASKPPVRALERANKLDTLPHTAATDPDPVAKRRACQ
ncbi:MAG: hypothetical protein KDB60_00455 [Propionibacteriaceae bacterium]|nr:hypothetical protein [Propionibacteriaceae bacterium]